MYSRSGPRIIRLLIPGIEAEQDRQRRLKRHDAATVIVVGSGLAGMSAAIEAADARAKVILLEKEPKTGGNSAKATSGIEYHFHRGKIKAENQVLGRRIESYYDA